MRGVRGVLARSARRPAKPDPGPPFYREVVREFARARIPFLVGGGYAFRHHTGIERERRDFDVFVLPRDVRRVLRHFGDLGFLTRLTHPHWLGKIYRQGRHVDVIYSSGNGIVRVDADWFAHARPGRFAGVAVRLCPIEEMIWSKSFVMERERFDGADVAHLIRAGGRRLDWRRVLARFGPFWRVLLAHVVLFDFVFPGSRASIPGWVRRVLHERAEHEAKSPARTNGAAANGRDAGVCRGTLLSRTEYLHDLAHGMTDGRLAYHTMSTGDVVHWTAAAHVPLPSTVAARAPASPARRARRRKP